MAKKKSRREFLKQAGSGAAVITGSSALLSNTAATPPKNFIGVSRRSNSELLSQTDTGVKITFSGMVFFQRNAQKQCLAHIIKFGTHRLMMDIQEIEFDPLTGLPVRASSVDLGHIFDPSKNIFVTGGAGNGNWVKLFLNGQDVLDKENPQTEEDEKDFRWLLNICGDEFGRQSEVRPNYDMIKQTIHLTKGVIYAEKLTDIAYESRSFKDGTVRYIGRAAYSVGVDIKLEGEGDAVCLSNSPTQAMNGEGLKLEYKANTQYRVTTSNLCRPPYDPSPIGSHSDFYAHFKNIFTQSNEMFDLVPLDRGTAMTDTIQRRNLTLDSDQMNCLPAGGENPPPGGG